MSHDLNDTIVGGITPYIAKVDTFKSNRHCGESMVTINALATVPVT